MTIRSTGKEIFDGFKDSLNESQIKPVSRRPLKIVILIMIILFILFTILYVWYVLSLRKSENDIRDARKIQDNKKIITFVCLELVAIGVVVGGTLLVIHSLTIEAVVKGVLSKKN